MYDSAGNILLDDRIKIVLKEKFGVQDFCLARNYTELMAARCPSDNCNTSVDSCCELNY